MLVNINRTAHAQLYFLTQKKSRTAHAIISSFLAVLIRRIPELGSQSITVTSSKEACQNSMTFPGGNGFSCSAEI